MYATLYISIQLSAGDTLLPYMYPSSAFMATPFMKQQIDVCHKECNGLMFPWLEVL